MASIHVKGNRFYVAVGHKEHLTGKYVRNWLPFDSMEAAQAFKDDLERKKDNEAQRQKSISTRTRTLEDLIWKYVDLVGKTKWGLKTYPTYIARIENYILPIAGDWIAWECDTLKMDQFFAILQKTPAVTSTKQKSGRFVSTRVVEEIHKFFKAMFACAEEWGYIPKNPCKKANRTIVKHMKEKRPFWEKDVYMNVLRTCLEEEDFCLLGALIIAVGTSCREGEICGLQWDRCYISDDDISNGTSRIFIDRAVARVEKYMLKQKPNEVKFVFPDLIKSSKSSLIMKTPKSDASNRTIWLPKTAAKVLRLLKTQQQQQIDFLGDAYRDYGLVFALDDGRAMENKVLYNRFLRFIEKHNFPKVVFHSTRHTSTTYKLKTSQGDVKSVQGDTGHANAALVVDVYAEIMDEDRRHYAQTFETDFFGNDSLLSHIDAVDGGVIVREQGNQAPSSDMDRVVALLRSNPSLMNQLVGLVQTITR